MSTSEAADAQVPSDEVAVLGWVDMNAPWARTKENCQALCRGLASLNEANPKMNSTVVILPDLARDSSLRGLYDEERQLFEELFSLSQACETRWVECYAGSPRKRRESQIHVASGQVASFARPAQWIPTSGLRVSLPSTDEWWGKTRWWRAPHLQSFRGQPAF